ncbi:MAG: sensor histidine kinase [Nocardioidaceae bacterium]
MTRRVLGALLVFTGVLLAAAVVPLGLETAALYRHDYADATISQARVISSIAEERLSDHEPGTSLKADLRRFVDGSTGVLLLDAHRTTVDSAGLTFPVPETLKAGASAGTETVGVDGESLQMAAVPIGTRPKPVGLVIVARTTEPLESRIRSLWLTLGGVALIAAATAAMIAVWLSRWVARPVRRLEETARFVGAGNLDARAGAVRGPPEVQRLAATFDTMAVRLRSLLDGQRDMLADVSHQLRTPMSALRLRLELLQRRQPSDQAELTGALTELERLSRLVDGLLAVARAEATTLVPTPVDLRRMVTERVASWSSLATERDIEVTLEPGSSVQAWAVPAHLEQIMDNLLANCFDLDPAPRQIGIRVSVHGDAATITVSDDGPGMSRLQRERAFQRFATGHADTGGTGLGLPIVHRLVNAMGGTIELQDGPTGGLSVAVRLPRAGRRRAGTELRRSKPRPDDGMDHLP